MTAPKPPLYGSDCCQNGTVGQTHACMKSQPLSGAATAKFDELSAEADKFTDANWHEMDRDVFKYELLKLLSRITRPAAPTMLDTCAGIALLYGHDDEYASRLRTAMETDDAAEMEHVTAVMVALLYGDNYEAARVASKKWSDTFKRPAAPEEAPPPYTRQDMELEIASQPAASVAVPAPPRLIYDGDSVFHSKEDNSEEGFRTSLRSPCCRRDNPCPEHATASLPPPQEPENSEMCPVCQSPYCSHEADEQKEIQAAYSWLINGGNGHEAGEDGFRAIRCSGSFLVETLAAYALHFRPAALAGETRTGYTVFEKLAEQALKSLELRGVTDGITVGACAAYMATFASETAASRIAQLERERLEIMKALCITEFFEDIPTEYEVPAEPEPVYVPTLKDAILKTIQLCENDCNKAEAALTQARQENSVELFCSYVDDILTGKDTGEGVGVSPWEPTRRKLLNLCAQKSALMEAIEPLISNPQVSNKSSLRVTIKTELLRAAARVYEQVKEKI